MPKVTKLHSKGKPQSLQKHHTPYETSSDNLDPEEAARQFQLELCWCIQQLEKTLSEKKGNEKQLQEIWKVLTVLKNNNQPIIRKRQLMRTHFGDYRAKMTAEEKKLVKMASKMKIGESSSQPKATFLRKSAFLSTGDNSFRFNFDQPSAASNEGNTNSIESVLNENTNSTDCVTNEHTDSTVCVHENTNSTLGVTNENTDSTEVPVRDDNSKSFKFKFTSSEFKFNFTPETS